MSWRVAAEIDEREALRPLTALRRQMALAAIVLSGIVALAVAGGALLITAPLRRVVAAIAALRANGGTARVPSFGRGEPQALAAAVNDLCEQGRTASAAERRRRDAELRDVIAVLDAARAGDPRQRAYAGGELGALATAVNAVCEQLGQRAAVPLAFGDLAASETLLAAVEHLRSEAARHLDAVGAAEETLRQAGARVERGTHLAARAWDAGRQAGVAAQSASAALDRLGAALDAMHADGVGSADTWQALSTQAAALATARARLADLATDLSVTAVNAALAATASPAAGDAEASDSDRVGQLAEAAAETCAELDAIAAETVSAAAAGAAGQASRSARLAECAEAAGALRQEAERLGASLRDGAATLADLTLSPVDLVAEQAAVGAARDAARRLCHAAEVVARAASGLCPRPHGDGAGAEGAAAAVFPEVGGD